MIQRNNNICELSWIDKLKGVQCTSIDNSAVEEKFSTRFGAHCLTISNGTSAIKLGLIALGLQPNDKIIIPAYGFHAAKLCCEQLNLDIVYADVSISTGCITKNTIEAVYTSDVKAVVFLNHMGYTGADLEDVANWCTTNNVLLIEDSAQALTHSFNGKYAGTFGDVGIYSFSGPKLVKLGVGGMCISKHKEVIDTVSQLRLMGIGNYMMSPILGKYLDIQFDELDDILEKRNALQERYRKVGVPIFNDTVTGSHSMSTYNTNAQHIYNELTQLEIVSRYKFYQAHTTQTGAVNMFNNFIELPQCDELTSQHISYIGELCN